VYYQDWILNLL